MINAEPPGDEILAEQVDWKDRSSPPFIYSFVHLFVKSVHVKK